MLVGYAVKLVSITALYIYMYFENKRRDREAATEISEDPVKDGIEQGMLVSGHSMYLLVLEILTLCQDQTELENKAFRYVL